MRLVPTCWKRDITSKTSLSRLTNRVFSRDTDSVHPGDTRRREQKGDPMDITAIPALQVTTLREVTMTGATVEVPTGVIYRRILGTGITPSIIIIAVIAIATTGVVVDQGTVMATKSTVWM